ncbi:MAG: KEOPS complex subunit Cgi121 [Methanothrix sp.]|nr:KEOPS complex subunit Cgi121 [Methanothrix sp.]
MNEIRLLFGKPVIRDRAKLISVLRDLQSRHGCVMQALDADKVVSERHIRFAAEKALAAISQGRNIAKDPGMEIMRYASGERQIERALAMGISDSTERMVLLLASLGDESHWPDASELSSLMKLDLRGCSFKEEAVKDAFNISMQEIETVGEGRIEELVIERVALVDTYR